MIAIEDKLRFAHAHEALDGLRRQLCARICTNKFKIKNITGQVANTKARECQKTIDRKTIQQKMKYRRAWKALVVLRGPGWQDLKLQELKDADVRAFNERAMTEEEIRERKEARTAAGLASDEVFGIAVEGMRTGDGRSHMSWIWWSAGTLGLCASHEDEDAYKGIY